MDAGERRQGSLAERRALFEAQQKAGSAVPLQIGGLQAAGLQKRSGGAVVQPAAADAQPLSLKERMAMLQGGGGGSSENAAARGGGAPEAPKRASVGAAFQASQQQPAQAAAGKAEACFRIS